MKEAWQHNAEFGGYAEPLPELPPPESGDDMARTKKTKPTVTAIFNCHFSGAEVGPIIVSEDVDGSADVSKVFARLASKAAMRLKTPHHRAE